MIVLLALDLNSIKSDPNLERRSDQALDYATTAMENTRDLYNAGDTAKWRDALDQVAAAIDLSYQSLTEAGKNARNDKHFKRAELKTRELLRRLDGLRDDVDFEDQSAVDRIRAKISQIHDELLQRIMSKKK